MFICSEKLVSTGLSEPCHAAISAIGGLSGVRWTLLTCVSVGGIGSWPRQYACCRSPPLITLGVQAELGARESSGSNLPRPLICLSGVKSLPRGPAIIDFPGTHQNVSVGGLKTRSMWQTSQARAASSSHQKPCASDFLFYSSCPPPIYSRLLLPSLRDPVEMSSNV